MHLNDLLLLDPQGTDSLGGNCPPPGDLYYSPAQLHSKGKLEFCTSMKIGFKVPKILTHSMPLNLDIKLANQSITSTNYLVRILV